MKVCWFGFLGKNHSWSIVGQNICRQLIKQGHEVDLFSTNGLDHFPDDLKKNLKGFIKEDHKMSLEDLTKYVKSSLQESYDMQLSYTALKNFSHYFKRGNKNRFGIWNYETTVLPPAFAKHYKSVDLLLPSSQFSKEIFLKNKIPESNMVVVPHGIHLDRFKNLPPYPLKTKKKYKILANIAQPHLRKNIPGLLTAYGKAFTNKDDVCLVLKISNKKPDSQSEVSFADQLTIFRSQFKNAGEVEIISHFVTDIESVYNACDMVFTMSHAECFWMPGLEGFAAKKLVIAPKYGGQLDFMNDDNSLLIPGKTVSADPRMQYWWTQSPHAAVFYPDTDAAADILRTAVNNYDSLMSKFVPNIEGILPNYTWDKVVEQIVSLCK